MFDDFPSDLRQEIAQSAARLMFEEGISDYGRAKRKAVKLLGIQQDAPLPTNAEIDTALREYHALYADEADAAHLHDLRQAALLTMQLLQKFNPHLTGPVLDGTAGPYADTDIHVFAESAKELEIYLLNQNIPYHGDEQQYRMSDRPGKQKHDLVRKRVPVVLVETRFGTQRISIFEADDIRSAPRKNGEKSGINRMNLSQFSEMVRSQQSLNTPLPNQ
ncbi:MULTISPECIES: hypothetical protein [unclassified Methylophilus]|jgi:hypothetical protein|uniref:hypothetical protein n=1 Tax=unclassified Methylophilus TaxID=2630143 RepID=UPI0006FCBC61|nr:MULTISPECIES: hypothetical protein [unclassified Methylophilus]KQT36656.1 hypothetical protein ASG24_05745 [Methylophilus sp. Leaf414]KQT41258.1 hypothetical protein ASG34_10930 [Methylophilus sp. Leaf416]KQT57780.1 hypothetical protein ASG44_12530 [Methylophilus sp. Leaf459]